MFCLNGEFALAVTDVLEAVGLGDHAALALAARGAGEQLQAPQLGLGQRWTLIGVVLLAGE